MISFVTLCSLAVQSQSVTEIITDFNGYWRSSSASPNSVKPNNSHNLLAFTFNGNRFSTGANDALIASKGLSYLSCDFRAIPLNTISGSVNSNTKVGLGALYDGVSNGPSNPAPARNLQQYLNDGIKGLDLGTGVANFPSGTLTFSVTNLSMSSIGDGFPDILITQFADPSGVTDKYEFIDSNGVRVGNAVDIILSNIPSVGTWTADFYEASTNPMILSSSFVATDRNLRLWAADFASFGVTAGNINRISGFRITTSGNSDLAFVAYNFNTFQVGLSHEEISLKATVRNDEVVLELSGESAPDVTNLFIERSINGVDYNTIHRIFLPLRSRDRTIVDQVIATGDIYYRLGTSNADGSVTYMRAVRVQLQKKNRLIQSLYPNPASEMVKISHEKITSGSSISVYNGNGHLIYTRELKLNTTRIDLDLTILPAGKYFIRLHANKKIETTTLLIVK